MKKKDVGFYKKIILRSESKLKWNEMSEKI